MGHLRHRVVLVRYHLAKSRRRTSAVTVRTWVISLADSSIRTEDVISDAALFSDSYIKVRVAAKSS